MVSGLPVASFHPRCWRSIVLLLSQMDFIFIDWPNRTPNSWAHCKESQTTEEAVQECCVIRCTQWAPQCITMGPAYYQETWKSTLNRSERWWCFAAIPRRVQTFSSSAISKVQVQVWLSVKQWRCYHSARNFARSQGSLWTSRNTCAVASYCACLLGWGWKKLQWSSEVKNLAQKHNDTVSAQKSCCVSYPQR